MADRGRIRRRQTPAPQRPNQGPEERKESSAPRASVFGPKAHPQDDRSQAAKDREDARREAEKKKPRPGDWTKLKELGRAWQKDVKPREKVDSKKKLDPIKQKGGDEDDGTKIKVPGDDARGAGNVEDDDDDRPIGISRPTQFKPRGKTGVKKEKKDTGDEQGDDTGVIRARGGSPIHPKSASPPKMEIIMGSDTGGQGTNIRITKPTRTVPDSVNQPGFSDDTKVNDNYEALLNSDPNVELGLADDLPKKKQPPPGKPPPGRTQSNPRRKVFSRRDSGEAIQLAQDLQREVAKKDEKAPADPVFNPRHSAFGPGNPNVNETADEAIRQSIKAIARKTARSADSDDQEPFVASQSTIRLSPRLQEIAAESQDDLAIQYLIRSLAGDEPVPEKEEEPPAGQPGLSDAKVETMDEKARKAVDKAKAKEQGANSKADARERDKDVPKVLTFIDALDEVPEPHNDAAGHPSFLDYAVGRLFPRQGGPQQDEPDRINPLVSVYRRAMLRRDRHQAEDLSHVPSDEDEVLSEQDDVDEPPPAPVIAPIDKPRKPGPRKKQINKPEQSESEIQYFPMDPITENDIQLNPALFDNTTTEAYQNADLDPVDMDEIQGYMRPRINRLMQNMMKDREGILSMFELSETLENGDLIDVRQTPKGDRTVFVFRVRGNLAFVANAPSGQGEWDTRMLDLNTGNVIQSEQLWDLVDGETRLRVGMLFTGMWLLHEAEQPEDEQE